MTEGKHTPGPWRVGAPGPNGCYTVGTEGGLMVAMLAHSVNHPDQKEQAIADAHLIAAAPKLQAMLQEVLCEWGERGDFRNGVTDPTGTIDEGDVLASQFLGRVADVLAESKGETP